MTSDPSNNQAFTIKNFEGPLDLLLYLIQKNELEIEEIPLQEITSQYLRQLEGPDALETGGQFLVTAANLMLIKSRALLPSSADDQEDEEEDPDPRFEMLKQVVEYCHFKEMAQDLSSLEVQQSSHFPRGKLEIPKEEMLPGELRLVPLDKLAGVLERALERAATREPRVIDHEEWHVSDAINWVRGKLAAAEKLSFDELFPMDEPKIKLIVNFLAILELMKMQEVLVVEHKETEEIYVMGRNEQQQ